MNAASDLLKVRIYADISSGVENDMRVICATIKKTRKAFLEVAIEQAVSAAKAALVAEKKAAKSKKE